MLPTLAPDERLDEVNEQIRLIQKKQGLTFGTDAFLLAAFVRSSPRARAVDLGSGTGIIPLLLCAFLFTPVDAVTVAVLGTLLEQILDPSPYGFMTLPMWLVPNAVLALVVALGAIRIRKMESRKTALVCTAVLIVCAEVLLTALNTAALYVDGYILGYSVKALHLLLPTRVANCFVRAAISCVVCLALIPPLRRQLKKMGVLS